MQAHTGTGLGGIAPFFSHPSLAGGPRGPAEPDPAGVAVLAADPHRGGAEPGGASGSYLAAIARHRGGDVLRAIGVEFGRDGGLTVALRALAGRRRRKWDGDEIAVLRARYPDADCPVSGIGGLLGRSPASVRGKARRLGLRRAKPTPDTPSSLARLPLPLPPPSPASAPVRVPKPYRVTRLGGRECVWNEGLVERLIRLWAAGFHHAVISEVLGVGARAASTKATRISLPARKASGLSRDVEAARLLDAAGGDLPNVLRKANGALLVRKRCALTGAWFYGPTGVHTCPEAKQTLYYERMLGLN